jgi:hypothetical protein
VCRRRRPLSRRELHRRTSGRALTSRLRRWRVHAAVNTFARLIGS